MSYICSVNQILCKLSFFLSSSPPPPASSSSSLFFFNPLCVMIWLNEKTYWEGENEQIHTHAKLLIIHDVFIHHRFYSKRLSQPTLMSDHLINTNWQRNKSQQCCALGAVCSVSPMEMKRVQTHSWSSIKKKKWMKKMANVCLRSGEYSLALWFFRSSFLFLL